VRLKQQFPGSQRSLARVFAAPDRDPGAAGIDRPSSGNNTQEPTGLPIVSGLLFFFVLRTFASDRTDMDPCKVVAIIGGSILEPAAKGESMLTRATLSKIATISLMAAGLLTIAAPVSARDKYETIDAQAFGTGTQMGQNIGITLNIYEFSTPADRQLLVQAFTKGQNKGLVNALQKMKAVGHIEITTTPTGRKIAFVTNRQITFGEAWADSQSASFNLTAGVLELNDQDKSKSTGMLYPLAQLILNKEGELQLELNQNPWKLVDIIDWKGTANN